VVRRGGQQVTEAELIAHLDGRLARYKIPKTIVFADDLPHTASGKILKPGIRQRHGAPREGFSPDQ
jgi:fatty-acyl-CoA synthase